MGLSVSVLASGSRGNATLLESASTRILVDAGLSCRETFKRMKAANSDPRTLSAILITHEHADHIYGLIVLANKLNLPVFMNEATYQAWEKAVRDACGEVPRLPKVELFSSGHYFVVGDITVMPFTIPHDAADPVGFTLRSGGVKVGIATDLGYLPPNVCDQLRGCDVLVIESNHDLEMLRGGPYPWSVKQRVMSRVGHLSNETLADFFARDYDGCASYIVLAHLSEQNNHPELARTAAERALGPRQNLLYNRITLAVQAGCPQPIQL
ncbi:MAG: MBL fold metallo-hydrolase [Acidobacteriales bacterium]|nr:MBL fold metallo-hydrolase [Terriglobales bacterium]